MDYDLEMDKVEKEIREKGCRLVCIQLPEGLKPKAMDISREIEKKTGAKVIIWAGSCFGACDTPDLEKFNVDLLIQWGHSPWE